MAENVSAVTIVTGADVDLPAQALTYSISGGTDQALFTINAATGGLSFTAPPNFEVATDTNGDNVYVVQVQVIDSQGASTTQTIQVMVTDVIEGLPPISTTPLIPPVFYRRHRRIRSVQPLFRRVSRARQSRRQTRLLRLRYCQAHARCHQNFIAERGADRNRFSCEP